MCTCMIYFCLNNFVYLQMLQIFYLYNIDMYTRYWCKHCITFSVYCYFIWKIYYTQDYFVRSNST